MIESSPATYLISFEDKIKDIDSAILIPISDQKPPVVWFTRDSIHFDLFATQNLEATVGDLLEYVNTRLINQGYGQANLNEHSAYLQNIQTKAIVKFMNKQEKLLPLLHKVGYKSGDNKTRRMNYMFVYKDNYVANKTTENNESGVTNSTKEETIFNNQTSNNDMLKSNLTNFFDFFYKESCGSRPRFIQNQPFLGHQPLGFFLPPVLIIDMRQIGSNLVNPKSGLSFNNFKQALNDSGILLNHKYQLKGLVCATKDSIQTKPSMTCYPVLVNGNEAVGFLGPSRQINLNKLDDRYIIAIVLERQEYDSESQ